MRLKADLRRVVRLTIQAAIAGAAWLGLAAVLLARDPRPTLGLITAMALVAGGALARLPGRPAWWVRALAVAAVVVTTRVALGTMAAIGAAAFLLVAVLLRLRMGEAAVGLAVFGLAVAAAGLPPIHLLGVFWLWGWATIALFYCSRALWRRARPRAPTTAQA